MKKTLNRRIIKHLIKEESETRKRYIALGKKYHAPALVRAGRQEGSHSRLFKRLLKQERFERKEKR